MNDLNKKFRKEEIPELINILKHPLFRKYLEFLVKKREVLSKKLEIFNSPVEEIIYLQGRIKEIRDFLLNIEMDIKGGNDDG